MEKPLFALASLADIFLNNRLVGRTCKGKLFFGSIMHLSGEEGCAWLRGLPAGCAALGSTQLLEKAFTSVGTQRCPTHYLLHLLMLFPNATGAQPAV